jgi:hypothetical protein
MRKLLGAAQNVSADLPRPEAAVHGVHGTTLKWFLRKARPCNSRASRGGQCGSTRQGRDRPDVGEGEIAVAAQNHRAQVAFC